MGMIFLSFTRRHTPEDYNISNLTKTHAGDRARLRATVYRQNAVVLFLEFESITCVPVCVCVCVCVCPMQIQSQAAELHT